MSEKTPESVKNVGPDSYTGKYYCSIRLFDYKRPKPFESAAEPEKKSINLPIPVQLLDVTASSFAQQDLGIVGDAFNLSTISTIESGALRALSGIAGLGVAGFGGYKKSLLTKRSDKNISDDLRDSLSTKIGRLDKIGAGAQLLGSAVNLDPAAISSAIQQTLGVVPNPNPSVKFAGPILRDASFTWYLNAKNEEESKRFNYIIKLLKSASLSRNETAGISGVLAFPKLAQINFYPWDNIVGNDKTKPNKWGWSDNSIIRLKRCFITQVNVNYNPTNVPAFFYDDSPVVIELSIGLKEVEYMTANDWDADGLEFEKEYTLSAAGSDVVEGLTSALSDAASAGYKAVTNAAKSITNDTRNAQQ
jgi:hypothetical protein